MIPLKIPLGYQRLILRKLCQRYLLNVGYHSTSVTIDAFDTVTNELLQGFRKKGRNNPLNVNDLSLRYFKVDKSEQKKDLSTMTKDEIDNYILELLSKKKDKLLEEVIEYCHENKILILETTVKKVFRMSSLHGKVDIVLLLQKYIMKLDPYLHRRNGEFLHYVAKAQCMKGNTEKGLSIILQCYGKYGVLRNFYRVILRELIHDSVLNRSEASLVVLKKYLLEISETYQDPYPLVCFWHFCWVSSWFSDQMFADELLESSKVLQDIVRDK